MENKVNSFKYVQFPKNDCILFKVNGKQKRIMFREGTEAFDELRMLLAFTKQQYNRLSSNRLKDVILTMKQLWIFNTHPRQTSIYRPTVKLTRSIK